MMQPGREWNVVLAKNMVFQFRKIVGKKYQKKIIMKKQSLKCKVIQKFKLILYIILLLFLSFCSNTNDVATDYPLLIALCYLTGFDDCQDSQDSNAISPDSIAGLQLWLKAETITKRPDGSNVGIWLDESGNANDAVQGTSLNQPKYYSGILNGQPVIRFDGTNDYFSMPKFMNFTDTTVLFVGLSRNSVAYGVIFQSYGGAANTNELLQIAYSSSDKDNFYARGNTTSYISFSGTENATVTHITSVQLSGMTGKMYSNGTSNGNLSNSSYVPPTDWIGAAYATDPIIGGHADVSQGWLNADIAEIIVYDSAISDTNRPGVECYLSLKYRISVAQTCY